LTGYSTSHEVERGMRYRTGGSGRPVIMSMSISYDRRTPVVGGHAGQTLEDFYRIHNLDEKRRKYLEDLRWQVNNLSTGGPLNNLLNAMGLNH
jgi:hypothetical protein